MFKWVLVLLTIYLMSCSPEKKEFVKTEVPDSTLIKIIADAHLADAAIYSAAYRNHRFTENRQRIFNDILKKHGVSDSAFYRSLRQLNKDPQQFRSIYESVIVRLSANPQGP